MSFLRGLIAQLAASMLAAAEHNGLWTTRASEEAAMFFDLCAAQAQCSGSLPLRDRLLTGSALCSAMATCLAAISVGSCDRSIVLKVACMLYGILDEIRAWLPDLSPSVHKEQVAGLVTSLRFVALAC
jgi:hypothetical protein